MTTMPSIVRRLIATGAARADEIRGCTEHEITHIRTDQGVPRLPASYVHFLRVMGRGAGRLLPGTDAFYPHLLGLKADTRALFQQGGFTLPGFADIVTIAIYQRREAYWLETFRDDDPCVFRYHHLDQAPCQYWPNLTSFLADATADTRRH
ncbi:MAG TPA: hypothetical protein VMU51_26900 [Mycobacteriales bacterium]|nr:hypothetical protein [Mycobacteriales bacterium]